MTKKPTAAAVAALALLAACVPPNSSYSDDVPPVPYSARWNSNYADQAERGGFRMMSLEPPEQRRHRQPWPYWESGSRHYEWRR